MRRLNDLERCRIDGSIPAAATGVSSDGREIWELTRDYRLSLWATGALGALLWCFYCATAAGVGVVAAAVVPVIWLIDFWRSQWVRQVFVYPLADSAAAGAADSLR
ncbi:hypothetical protein [Lacipirellula sp.]|uniref:hypothetical protein n=1 Tax=Lacipirellula sp. TaxID=2691419 RepID=UPI003D10D471